MITLLNSSILTAFGTYSYEPILLDDARKLVANGFQSAIGHESTATLLGKLLNLEVPTNRIEYRQQTGEQCLVFKLKFRPAEGAILTIDEIIAGGYEFGLLTKLA